MEAIWHSMCDSVPDVRADLVPALIRGTAALAHRAFTNHGLDDLLAFINRPAPTPQDRAALTLDTALAHELRFQPRPCLQRLKPEQDHAEGDHGEVVGSAFLVAGGDAAPLLEAVDQALDSLNANDKSGQPHRLSWSGSRNG